MKKIYFLQIVSIFLLFDVLSASAATMGEYLQLQIAADQFKYTSNQEARKASLLAQNVLTDTDQTLAEAIMEMNAVAAQQGHAIFCPPNNFVLNASKIKMISKKAFATNAAPEAEKLKLSVASFVVHYLVQAYPCQIVKK